MPNIQREIYSDFLHSLHAYNLDCHFGRLEYSAADCCSFNLFSKEPTIVTEKRFDRSVSRALRLSATFVSWVANYTEFVAIVQQKYYFGIQILLATNYTSFIEFRRMCEDYLV